MSTRPRAFRLDPGSDGVVASATSAIVTDEPSDAIEAADGVPVIAARRRHAPWLAIFVSALGGLATLAIGVGIERLIADLFQAAPWLGWAALALSALALVAFLALVGRECAGLLRERRIEHLRAQAADALAVRDHAAARTVVQGLMTLPSVTGRTRELAELKATFDEIMDADDRLAVAERLLVVPLDERVKRAVAEAARQVSVVTAISPRAVVDVAFVVFAAVRLLRRIAGIYGGRPGFFGFMRLARSALNHLAVTGGVAVGDSLLQQALGLGLAARVSAKLGEGALNGLMTARFGLAAMAVCRPLPFVREPVPRLGDVAGELFGPERAGRDPERL